MSHARPSVTKKQREQKRRERMELKAEKRAMRKIAHQNAVESGRPESEFEPQASALDDDIRE